MDVNIETHAVMPPVPELPITPERRCPVCQSEKINHAGYVIAADRMIKYAHRCEPCGTTFWFVRNAIGGS